MTEKEYQIERGTTTISVPHLVGKLPVAYPFFGPRVAKALRDEIRAAGLIEPTLGEVVSFGYVAYGNKDEREFVEAERIMKNNYFRGFTATHSTGDKRLERGLVYILDFPEFREDGRVYVDDDDLVEKLGRGDPSVRIIPKKNMPSTGLRTPTELFKDVYVTALIGGGQTEKIAKLAERHPSKEGFVWVPDMSSPKTTIAALVSVYYGSGLNVSGYDVGLDGGGFAFGVRRVGARGGGGEKKKKK